MEDVFCFFCINFLIFACFLQSVLLKNAKGSNSGYLEGMQ